ncbi:EamA family transporter [Chitinophaga ginsengisoli]|uniref:Drug/metabolite transporter (DMT)-like permease n=1 Tax=Chitinophaga ginsengisoli TaxID=363837 RepID=A0A2P8FW11_9BACT|nr:EamA family transporter [Chitinophaga ginsengisoli]PSL25901.1 drug/metabolite transporter (DMT)-like permease [Chitinophaga ginsengisoli]
MKKSNTNAYMALVVVSIFWGTTYLASRIGVRHMHGLMLAGIRQTIAGILLTSFFLLKGYKVPEKFVLSRLFVIGVMMLCLSNGLITWAMQYIPSGLCAIIVATVPIWITIFSYFLVQRTKFTIMLIAGMLIGLLGVGGIFYDYLSSLTNPDFRFGIFLTLIACISWAIGSVLTARWALKINFLYGAGFQMLFSGIVMTIVATMMGQSLPLDGFNIELWGSLLYLIFIGSILGYSSYVFVLNNLPPSLASVYAYINPIVAVLLGWLILQEHLNWVTGLSCLVTLGGVYMVNKAVNKNKQQYGTTTK